MQTLFKTFYDIIVLRKGPEDLPSSVVLLAFAGRFLWQAARFFGWVAY